jgi:hypothetical protein
MKTAPVVRRTAPTGARFEVVADLIRLFFAVLDGVIGGLRG